MKLGDVEFRGASGRRYIFERYSIETQFNNVAAVYVFIRADQPLAGTTNYIPLYIGETGELGDRITGHEKWGCAKEYGVDSIGVLQGNEAGARLAAETDLRRAHRTPCNEQ